MQRSCVTLNAIHEGLRGSYANLSSIINLSEVETSPFFCLIPIRTPGSTKCVAWWTKSGDCVKLKATIAYSGAKKVGNLYNQGW